MIDTVALREKVLDLAIRGKLVPQDPSDEPASVLLERIRAQKQQMVKEGKLKAKDIKDDSIIFVGEDNLHYEKFADGTVKCIEEEIPFDLPIGWVWTRFRVFCPYGDCEKYETTDIADDSWILDLEDIEKNTGRILAYATKAERNAVSTKHRFYKGQLLYSKLRPYLNKVVIAPKDGYCTSEILPLKLYDRIHPNYIQLFLMSSTFLSYVNMISYGVKMPRLGTDDGRKALIALPPLQEQVRIVEKYECIVPCISELQLSCDELTSSITAIKSKILDLAIRGKLVPQNPEDEPASVLLERIRAEKEEMIRQGKIKRDKKESVIFKGEDNSYYEKIGETTIDITDEIPFEPIIAMEFVRYKSVLELVSGRDLLPSEYNDYGKGIPYITGASNFANGVINIVRWTHSPQVITRCGDLLITCKGTVGEMAFNSFGEAHIARQVMAIRNIHSLNIDYVSLCIKYHIEEIKTAAKGLIPGISREDILELIIPLPSEAYQTRVVTRVNEMFSFIDSIEKSLM